MENCLAYSNSGCGEIKTNPLINFSKAVILVNIIFLFF